MLSKKMLAMLNEQITLEFFSSNLYLQMSSWCTANGLEGSARFLLAHSNEERMHMEKLFQYVNETGGMAVIDAIEKPKTDFKDLYELFRETLDHERLVTKKINELVDAAFSEKDFSTFQFLQWYVAEQHEEEALFMSVLDKVKVIGTEGRGLYLIDKEIGKLATRE